MILDVLTHRWLVVKTCKKSGIDMPAAFDTINKRHLLERVKTIADENENTLIQFLSEWHIHSQRISGTSNIKNHSQAT